VLNSSEFWFPWHTGSALAIRTHVEFQREWQLSCQTRVWQLPNQSNTSKHDRWQQNNTAHFFRMLPQGTCCVAQVLWFETSRSGLVLTMDADLPFSRRSWLGRVFESWRNVWLGIVVAHFYVRVPKRLSAAPLDDVCVTPEQLWPDTDDGF
jgi:hypothetical protein